MHIPVLIGAVIGLFFWKSYSYIEQCQNNGGTRQNKTTCLETMGGDFIIVGVSGPIGYYLVKPLAGEHLSIIIGFAAGTLLIFASRELITQAYRENSGYLTDISIVAGFLFGFVLFNFL